MKQEDCLEKKGKSKAPNFVSYILEETIKIMGKVQTQHTSISRDNLVDEHNMKV